MICLEYDWRTMIGFNLKWVPTGCKVNHLDPKWVKLFGKVMSLVESDDWGITLTKEEVAFSCSFKTNNMAVLSQIMRKAKTTDTAWVFEVPDGFFHAQEFIVFPRFWHLATPEHLHEFWDLKKFLVSRMGITRSSELLRFCDSTWPMILSNPVLLWDLLCAWEVQQTIPEFAYCVSEKEASILVDAVRALQRENEKTYTPDMMKALDNFAEYINLGERCGEETVDNAFMDGEVSGDDQ